MRPEGNRLLAEKVVRELFRIAQSYGQTHSVGFEDLVHDLALMLEVGSLNSVSLKFHRPNARETVLVEYNYAFHAGRPQFHLDDAQGLGIVPLSPPIAMALVVNRGPATQPMTGQFRLNWGAAPEYRREAGFEHRDGNTAQRTGGRASKQVFIGDDLRREGQVKHYWAEKQYGFITGRDGVDVFFHASNLQGFQPQRGQSVTYLPLVTPRGVQAKDVRPAR